MWPPTGVALRVVTSLEGKRCLPVLNSGQKRRSRSLGCVDQSHHRLASIRRECALGNRPMHSRFFAEKGPHASGEENGPIVCLAWRLSARVHSDLQERGQAHRRGGRLREPTVRT